VKFFQPYKVLFNQLLVASTRLIFVGGIGSLDIRS
jgi:putative NADH-flavin reductase